MTGEGPGMGPSDDRDPLEGWDLDAPDADVIDLAAYRPQPLVTPARVAVVAVLAAVLGALWERRRRTT
ncbi:MAG: hypothetical protein KY469_08525 [Actinobacteria bacterium]|nr:hypothetical protein [Actinomycetota bacterium]